MVSGKYNEFGYNIQSYKMLLNKECKVNVDKRLGAIRAFTSTNVFLQLLYKAKGFKVKKIGEQKRVLSNKNQELTFKRFSDCLHGNKQDLKRVKSTLLNYKKRRGKCHEGSLLLFNCMGDYIVTGYVDHIGGKHRCVHTWIEQDEKVYDYTSNLVVEKEEFYKLLNAEILNKISRDDFLSDINDKSDFVQKYLSAKMYLLFRDELVREGLIKPAERKVYKK